jgi:hypothetical protein
MSQNHFTRGNWRGEAAKNGLRKVVSKNLLAEQCWRRSFAM